ncbi:diacylglycerol kinase family protein [Pseudochryseolinea flava]|uniref:Diacylglycerol kinase family protein n=1 Tax=Pseudochryseolinea flava TaxID=2059302 RepID=A0A364Y5B5_9BACT|nr:diacylglycerol kinase family protein [Pseudochryseolinea flava]RAW02188.1 diacylglycerol kinase family protein [Pseudochryseolinea flava]
MLRKHLTSYKYAARGIWIALRHEPNMIVHVLAAIAVVFVNYLLNISRQDWIITLMLIGVVFTAEIFNTAIETLADRITKDQDPMIGKAKDLAAGAVLMIGLIAATCAVIVYWPYLF